MRNRMQGVWRLLTVLLVAGVGFGFMASPGEAAPAVDSRVAAVAAQQVGPASLGPVAGDYFVWRYNVSSGDYDVTVRHGNSADNYCQLFISDTPYSLGRYSTQLETDTGAVLDYGPTLYLHQGDVVGWTIEPGAAVPQSQGPQVQVGVSRWVGGADGHYEFVHLVHIGLYGPYQGRNRLGAPGSQNWNGC